MGSRSQILPRAGWCVVARPRDRAGCGRANERTPAQTFGAAVGRRETDGDRSHRLPGDFSPAARAGVAPPNRREVGGLMPIRVVNIIPQSLSGETNFDSEPSI